MKDRAKLKIGVYVLKHNAKENYKCESYDIRQNAGMEVVCDMRK